MGLVLFFKKVIGRKRRKREGHEKPKEYFPEGNSMLKLYER